MANKKTIAVVRLKAPVAASEANPTAHHIHGLKSAGRASRSTTSKGQAIKVASVVKRIARYQKRMFPNQKAAAIEPSSEIISAEKNK